MAGGGHSSGAKDTFPRLPVRGFILQRMHIDPYTSRALGAAESIRLVPRVAPPLEVVCGRRVTAAASSLPLLRLVYAHRVENAITIRAFLPATSRCVRRCRVSAVLVVCHQPLRVRVRHGKAPRPPRIGRRRQPLRARVRVMGSGRPEGLSWNAGAATSHARASWESSSWKYDSSSSPATTRACVRRNQLQWNPLDQCAATWRARPTCRADGRDGHRQDQPLRARVRVNVAGQAASFAPPATSRAYVLGLKSRFSLISLANSSRARPVVASLRIHESQEGATASRETAAVDSAATPAARWPPLRACARPARGPRLGVDRGGAHHFALARDRRADPGAA